MLEELTARATAAARRVGGGGAAAAQGAAATQTTRVNDVTAHQLVSSSVRHTCPTCTLKAAHYSFSDATHQTIHCTAYYAFVLHMCCSLLTCAIHRRKAAQAKKTPQTRGPSPRHLQPASAAPPAPAALRAPPQGAAARAASTAWQTPSAAAAAAVSVTQTAAALGSPQMMPRIV